MLLLSLLLTSALAACPDLETFPADGSTDVPPEIGHFWVQPLTYFPANESLQHPCFAEFLVLARTDKPGSAIDEGGEISWFSSVELSILAPYTEYQSTITRRNGESSVIRFTTGDLGRPVDPPIVDAVDLVVEAADDSHMCATLTARLTTLDPWVVVASDVGRPTAWRRADVGATTVELSTLTDSSQPRSAAGELEEACFHADIFASDGSMERIERCVPITRTGSFGACPYDNSPPDEGTGGCASDGCSSVSDGSSGLILGAWAVWIALVRRRR